ncbi:MAG: hypothetical protein K2R98_31830 [Gemmataceae bacterium]|nr:hypothetical protein [Gemmataceae bacterium]
MVGASVLIGLVLSVTPAEASPDELRVQAEAAFEAGVQQVATAPDEARQHFVRAARLYDQLRTQGSANAALYCNLGNAYFLANDLPHAILAYRQGLRLAPNDHELRRNLAYAREEVKFPPPGVLGRAPVDHRPPWLPRLPAWALFAALALYSLGCLAAMRWWMVRRGRWLLAAGGALAGAGLLQGALLYEMQEDRQVQRYPLVVIAEDGVLMRRGNGLTYEARYQTTLNRGVEGRLLFQRGNWVQIELSGGEVGWVPRQMDNKTYVLVDEPEPSP